MKFAKKWLYLTALVVGLAACTSTQSINQEAEQAYSQVQSDARQKGLLDNTSNTSKRVHSVFNRLKPYAQKANKTGVPFQWEMVVLKSDELNAWAMPGGKMAVYTGLVDKLSLNDDEIAVVIGHEMAHALEEHGKSNRTVGTITSVLGTVADAAVMVATGIDTGGLMSVGVDLVTSKPFSRSQETEADEVGLFLMAEAGYNPQAAPNVWVKMSKGKSSSSSVASIFSTHPSNAERQENLQRLIPEAMKVYNARK